MAGKAESVGKAIGRFISWPLETGAKLGSKVFLGGAKATGGAVGGTAGASFGFAKGFLAGAKKPLIAAGIVGAVAAAIYTFRGKPYKSEVPDPLDTGLPPMDMGMDPMAQSPQTMMGMQPVEGPMAQRVLAGRGMTPGVDTGLPGTPNIDGKPVQDLGAPRGM